MVDRSSFDLIAPAGYAWAVTPSDTVDISESRAVYVGTGGDVVLHAYDPTTNNKASVTLANVPDGTLLPIRTTRVLATGTTATNIVALA